MRTMRLSNRYFAQRFLGQFNNHMQKASVCLPSTCVTFKTNFVHNNIFGRGYVFYTRRYSVNTTVNFSKSNEISEQLFDAVCEETLESLTEFLEELVDTNSKLKCADISYSSGVLTINLDHFGTYVINRQTPNKQIWLSSPISGPKRYDYIVNWDFWWYKHENQSLHELLGNEFSTLLKEKVDFSKCFHSKKR